MFSPEKSQIEICLLKSSLEEIENKIVVQQSSLPDLEAENDRNMKKTFNAVRVSRTLSVEIENLNQENVRLVARRMHLKMQSEELSKTLEKAFEERGQMEISLHQEHQDLELLVKQYEDSLREKAERFRKTRMYYDKEKMMNEIENVNMATAKLERELNDLKKYVGEKRKQIDELGSKVPEHLLEIVGKKELEKILKTQKEKCELLEHKKNQLLKKNNPYLLTVKK